MRIPSDPAALIPHKHPHLLAHPPKTLKSIFPLPPRLSPPPPPASQNPIPLPPQPLHPLILPIIQILRRKPIILLIDIPRFPPLHPLNPQLLIPAQGFDFAVVPLVAEGGGRGQEEGARDDGGDEGEAEEEERVSGEGGAVGGGEGGGEGFGDVFFGGKGWHGGLWGGCCWSMMVGGWC